ncbi:MAG: hypothetical protein ACK5NN_11830 [Sphingomonadaceae bacterium]
MVKKLLITNARHEGEVAASQDPSSNNECATTQGKTGQNPAKIRVISLCCIYATVLQEIRDIHAISFATICRLPHLAAIRFHVVCFTA